MNLSLLDLENAHVLVVSQFTLYADVRKGRRPSFTGSARPEIAIPLYEEFVQLFSDAGLRTVTGDFGADMAVEILNDGPVTIWVDSADLPKQPGKM